MVGKEWEGKAWPRVTVGDLNGFIVIALVHLRVPGESLLCKHAIQEVLWSGEKKWTCLGSEMHSMQSTGSEAGMEPGRGSLSFRQEKG